MHRGARLVLLRSGRLELVARTGTRLWSTPAYGSGARLVLRNDGVLALLRGSHLVWHAGRSLRYGTHANPAPRASLAAGGTLRPGHYLTSANGRYRAIMATDGAFVIIGAGRTVWATETAGWTGAALTLSTGGTLLLRSASGTLLWSSHTAHGVLLVLSDGGDLVLENAAGRAIWQSGTTSRPQLAPRSSTSHYVRNITGAASDATTMSTTGCADAKANGTGTKAVVLDIGSQRTDVAGAQWGVLLTGTSTKLTDVQLVSAVEGYVQGYGGCMSAGAKLLLAVATNNDSHQYYVSGASCPTPPAGTPDPLGTEGGTDWAANVVAPVAAYAQGKGAITVAGANDIEANFTGCVGQATSWTTAYLAGTQQPYVFIGSAWGCPTQLGQTGAACEYGWTQQAMYDLAYGLAPTRSVPLPQIYISAQAAQWADISATGGSPLGFGGVLTSVAACAPAGSGCTSYQPAVAWNMLSDRLDRLAVHTRAGAYTTDLRVD